MRAAHANLGPFAYAGELACGVEQNKLHVFNTLANWNCLFRAGSHFAKDVSPFIAEKADRPVGFGGAVKNFTSVHFARALPYRADILAG